MPCLGLICWIIYITQMCIILIYLVGFDSLWPSLSTIKSNLDVSFNWSTCTLSHTQSLLALQFTRILPPWSQLKLALLYFTICNVLYTYRNFIHIMRAKEDGRDIVLSNGGRREMCILAARRLMAWTSIFFFLPYMVLVT